MLEQDEFLEFVATVLGVSCEGLLLATAYGAISEWDSVMHLRLVMEIQDRYGVDIPLEKVPELKTLGDFYAFVCQRPRVSTGEAAAKRSLEWCEDAAGTV